MDLDLAHFFSDFEDARKIKYFFLELTRRHISLSPKKQIFAKIAF
jgi:hypothetical protein